MKTKLAALAVATAVLMLAGSMSNRVLAADNPLPQPVAHLTWNASDPLAAGDGTPNSAQLTVTGGPICSTSSSQPNVNTDCEGVGPHDETAIVVNPKNALNLIAGANDYQITLTPGGTTVETVLSRAHVSMDGGTSWTTYAIPFVGYTGTGDPAIAFDADGTAYYATLGFVFPQGGPMSTNPDVVVSHSTDGGQTWSRPAIVAKSSGSLVSVGNFNDKEEIAAWGHGNAIVTWTLFKDGIHGSYGGSAIHASVTHDGGRTWTPGVAISGSAPFCAGFGGGTACDQDQGSVPVVAADGSIYVAFFSFTGDPSGRDQYLVVQVDPATGGRVAGPFQIGLIYDGSTDYPVSAGGRPTYQDSQFRTWAFGNIAADPTNPAHLAMAWSDMRNSTLPAPSDPYQAKTNSDVIVSQSLDAGRTWSAPTAIATPGDQFMPWASYGKDGLLRVGYFDRSYDPANHAYGYTLAKETSAASLHFATTQVTTQLSDPTQGTRWFSRTTVNPSFPHPTQFLGDYSGIDASRASGTAALWTDLRNVVTFAGRTGTGEDAYYSAGP